MKDSLALPPANDMHPLTSPNTNGHVLNSWKEIAQYMGLGVRTVQRYEAELGLPVRRPGGKDRGSVMALSGEIDRWLLSSPTRGDHAADHPVNCEDVAKLLDSILQHASACPECSSRLHSAFGSSSFRQS